MSPLAAVRAGEGPVTVLVHGFTQTASSMAPLARMLESRRRVVRVDLPGHGGSASISSDLDGAASLVVDAAEGEPFDLVGYSLGGRVALHAACQSPMNLRSTVVISASVGIADPVARERRLERDHKMAEELAASGDVEAFLERWLANPMFATLPRSDADLEGRRANTAAGLADSLRRCSLGAQRWLHDELEQLERPVLMLAGSRDDPFVAVAAATAAPCRSVKCAVVAGSGHVCHLEQPALTARLIECFLPAG
jgi:2-succinyl-6-hydroxy-2,4-cyclohexadiene-1-carboxylate synthase